jgi:hypothetical protein
MSRGLCLSRLSEPELDLIDVFVTVKIHQKRYRSCMTHLCTSKTTFHKELSAIIMANSSTDLNTSGSTTVGLIHVLVRKTIPTSAIHTIFDNQKLKVDEGQITPCPKLFAARSVITELQMV